MAAVQGKGVAVAATPGAATFPVEPSGATLYGGAGTRPVPEYSGRFIPTIWSGKILEKFYDSTVLAAISNTDYEGEIKNQGDHVVIRTRPTITINNYAADQILSVERPSSDIIDLLIDKGIYWNTVLDDVMEVQSDLNQMSMWAEDASEQMKITIDREVLDGMYADVDSDNKGATAGALSGNIDLGVTGTPVDLTGGATVGATNIGLSAINKLAIQMGQALDEQNIPETGRFLVVSPAVASLIKMSELRQVQVSGDGTSMMRNGQLGMLDRFMVYVSNLLPAGTSASTTMVAGESIIYAGSSIGLTFASQLTKVETLRAETTFGTLMRGLNVYGHKVVQPTALVGAIVKA
jgi:hypothetical protein